VKDNASPTTVATRVMVLVTPNSKFILLGTLNVGSQSLSFTQRCIMYVALLFLLTFAVVMFDSPHSD